MQGRGQPCAHHSMASEWPATWHRQDGCWIKAYRFTRRKFVLLQRLHLWPEESVSWSRVRLRRPEQRRSGDQQKCFTSHSRFESSRFKKRWVCLSRAVYVLKGNKKVRKLIKMVNEMTGDQMSKFGFFCETNSRLIELWQHAVFVEQTGRFTLHSSGAGLDLIETWPAIVAHNEFGFCLLWFTPR